MGRGGGAGRGRGIAVVPVISEWAQCENSGCQKWRRLPPGAKVDPDVPWFCYMNPDVLRNSCEAPEESYNDDVEGVTVTTPAGGPDDEAYEPVAAGSSGGAGRGRGRRGGGGRRGRGRGRRGGGRGRGSSAERRQSEAEGLQPWPSQKGLYAEPDTDEDEEEWEREDSPREAKRQRTGGSGAAFVQQQPNGYSRGHDAAADGPSSTPTAGMAWQRPAEQQALSQPQPPPRGTAKARKAHGAFEKLLAAGGVWETAKGRRAEPSPPQWVWEGFAQFAPGAAELAARGLDLAAAAAYFDTGAKGIDAEQPHVEQLHATARLGVMLAAAAAADSAAGSLAASAPMPQALPPAMAAAQQLPGPAQPAFGPPLPLMQPALPAGAAGAALLPSAGAALLPSAGAPPAALPVGPRPQPAGSMQGILHAQAGSGLMGAFQQQQAGMARGFPMPANPQQQPLRLPGAPGPGLTGLLPGFASGPGRPPFFPGDAPATAALQLHPQQQQQQWPTQPLNSRQVAAPSLSSVSAQQPQLLPAVQQQLPQGSATSAMLPPHSSQGAAAKPGAGPSGAMLNGHHSALGTGSASSESAHAPPQQQQQPPSGPGDGPGPILPLKEQLRHCGGFDVARQGDPLGAQHAKQLDNGAH